MQKEDKRRYTQKSAFAASRKGGMRSRHNQKNGLEWCCFEAVFYEVCGRMIPAYPVVTLKKLCVLSPQAQVP
jgi:hypothetical protein